MRSQPITSSTPTRLGMTVQTGNGSRQRGLSPICRRPPPLQVRESATWVVPLLTCQVSASQAPLTVRSMLPDDGKQRAGGTQARDEAASSPPPFLSSPLSTYDSPSLPLPSLPPGPQGHEQGPPLGEERALTPGASERYEQGLTPVKARALPPGNPREGLNRALRLQKARALPLVAHGGMGRPQRRP